MTLIHVYLMINVGFKDPEVTDVNPKKGPVSGGTYITIGGEYMDAGTMTTVSVGGGPCKVIRYFSCYLWLLI